MDKRLRNRIIWAEALATAQGPDPSARALAVEWAAPVLRFYFAFRDGTGDVERTDIAAYVVVKLLAFLEENASLLGEGGAQKGRKPEEYHPLPVATKESNSLD